MKGRWLGGQSKDKNSIGGEKKSEQTQGKKKKTPRGGDSILRQPKDQRGGR